MIRRCALFVVLVALLFQTAHVWAAITFLEAGGDATSDLGFWASTFVSSGGSVGIDTTGADAHSGPNSLKIVSGASSVDATSASGVFADAGTRMSVWMNYSSSISLAGTHLDVFGDLNGSSQRAFRLELTGSPATLAVIGDGGSLAKAGSTTVATGSYHRIATSWVLTSTSSYTIKVWLDGNLELTATGADGTLGQVGGVILEMGPGDGAPGTGGLTTQWFDDLYVDNASTLDDPGAIQITAKLPASNSTNNFDTAIGSCANRWDCVDERPLSELKGWQHAGSTQVAESYGIQTASAGDVDVSSATIVGYSGWAWARADNSSQAPYIVGANQNKASGTSFNVSTPSPCCSVNDAVVFTVADQVSGALTISNAGSAIVTWTALSSVTNTCRLSAWVGVVTGAGSVIPSVSFASSSAARAGVSAAFTALAASPQDKNPTALSDSSSPYTSPLSTTLAQADEVVVGYFSLATPGTDTVAAVSPDTIPTAGNTAKIGTTGSGATSNCISALTYRVVTATTSVAPGITDSTTTTRAGVAGTVTLKSLTPAGAGTPKLTVNGSDNSITLPTSSNIVSAFTTSASYPSGAFGMKSTGTAADTYFYEGGVQVAYVPGGGPPPAATPNRMPLLGVRDLWARMAGRH